MNEANGEWNEWCLWKRAVTETAATETAATETAATETAATETAATEIGGNRNRRRSPATVDVGRLETDKDSVCSCCGETGDQQDSAPTGAPNVNGWRKQLCQ